MNLLARLDLRLPIIQAPMAGVSTPELAAAVSNAGGLGSIGLGAVDAWAAKGMIEELRARTNRAFNVNLFVHARPKQDGDIESRWLHSLAPLFRQYDAAPPTELKAVNRSFAEDDDMLAVLLEVRPPVVSFHFGLPDAKRIAALKSAGCALLCTATNLEEAAAAERAGMDAIVAQGYEAGGHRGAFDPTRPDDRLGALALTRILAVKIRLPIVAAGGIMDGAGIAAALRLGAVAAQLGTAFVGCPESSADAGYRDALKGPGAAHTTMTTAISGRPARCLQNKFTEWGRSVVDAPHPDYSIAYDAGKALNAAAKAKGDYGFGAQWAGQGAPLCRFMPAAQLVAALASELASAARAGAPFVT